MFFENDIEDVLLICIQYTLLQALCHGLTENVYFNGSNTDTLQVITEKRATKRPSDCDTLTTYNILQDAFYSVILYMLIR